MKYKAMVYGASEHEPSLEVVTDHFNIAVILDTLGKQYGWVYGVTWSGQVPFETEVGTLFQFENSRPGRLVIEEVK